MRPTTTLEQIKDAPRADQELTGAVAVLSPDAPADRPRLVNPLEPYIKYIEEAQQYLTPALTARLRAVLPQDGLDLSHGTTLDELLPKLSKLITRMHSATISSTDTKELRDVFNASKDMIKLIASMQERLDAERQLAKIEAAVIAACDELGDEALKERFLKELKVKLWDEAA